MRVSRACLRCVFHFCSRFLFRRFVSFASRDIEILGRASCRVLSASRSTTVATVAESTVPSIKSVTALTCIQSYEEKKENFCMWPDQTAAAAISLPSAGSCVCCCSRFRLKFRLPDYPQLADKYNSSPIAP